MSEPTLTTIQTFSRVLLQVREVLAPTDALLPDNLLVVGDGLSTGMMPFPETADAGLAMWLDLRRHQLVIATTYGTRFELTLLGHSAFSFASACVDALATLGVLVSMDMALFSSKASLIYEPEMATRFLAQLT